MKQKVKIPKVIQHSATSLPYPDNYFDAVFTDSPYYDNVPYSYLSDFFYVWLKRSIGDLYPELFMIPLTPKSKEIVAYSHQDEIKRYIARKLEALWEKGVSGADFFIAGIGSAIEIFGKYKKIMDYEGNEMGASELLYLLWCWTYGEAKLGGGIQKNGSREEMQRKENFWMDS